MDPRLKKDKTAKIYLSLLLPAAAAVFVWSLVGFPLDQITPDLVLVAMITIAFGSSFQIQLPRTKIHFTASDILIFIAMLLYGGHTAVIIGTLETIVASLNMRRKGHSMRAQTVAINTSISSISVFASAATVMALFGSAQVIMQTESFSTFVFLLFTIAAAQFVVNSVLVSAFIAIRTDQTIWKVWNETCFNTLVMFLCGAVIAGLVVKALQQIDPYLFAAVTVFFGIVFLTYRRYVNDVKATAAVAENAERERAEEAELHVKELEHFILELEKSGEALTESHERLKHSAFHDALTGLPNRNSFQAKIKELINICKEGSGSGGTLYFLDLDGFKKINDSLGYATGDKLLRKVTKRLSKLAGESASVGRFGGDEFAVLVPAKCSAEESSEFAKEILRSLSTPYDLNGLQVFSSASIGISRVDRSSKKADDVMRDADIAMYYAKESKNAFRVFDERMRARAVNRLQLETDLRIGMTRDEFEVYYQPIVALDVAELKGFEALVRWNHPIRGQVPPMDFIPVSEATGLIIPLTLRILEISCKQMQDWRGLWPERPFFVSVNLSGRHFVDPELVNEVAAILSKTGLDPSLLRLEITETAVMENGDIAIEMLRELRALGVKISIDDFGTGYSSLSYLHKFPVDTLKVDRSFVNSIEMGSENHEIVKTIVALAKVLNLSVVAEGIEHSFQFERLRTLQCEYGQGYLFSKPVAARDMPRLLEDAANWINYVPLPSFDGGDVTELHQQLIH